MTRNEREHMKKLSLEVYGTTSKWQKVLNKGERVTVMSKRRADKNNGEEVEVGYYQHPTLDELRTGLEQRAKELADEKKLKESKNVGSIKLPGESTDTAGAGDRPSGGSTPS